MIGLFGGSFNPPHVAHQLVALYVLETQPIDQVWIVPTFAHPFGKQLASYEDRIAMCEHAARPLGPRVKVSRAEQELARRPGFVASRTLDLVEYLVEQGHTLRLIVGSDILAEAAKWHRWDAIVAAAPLIVIGRAGHALPAGSRETGVTMPEVSATRVRELVAAGGDASGLVPREVLWYIGHHHLYTP